MSDWVPIEQWPDCVRMERPGIVFELVNTEGLTLVTPCVVPLPEVPFDWKSLPVRFRAIPEPKPVHSAPIPAPAPRPE
jgi:hypothetical protein